MPTKSDVPTFKPIWNWNALPTRLIIKIRIPPKMEFVVNFKIAFIGIENTFPIIHKPIMQTKMIIVVEKSKFYHHTF